MSRIINLKKKKNGTDRTNGNTSFIDIISNIICKKKKKKN